MGGYNRAAGYLSSVEMYDPLIDIWTSITPMNERRSYLGAVQVAGSVYAIGGFGGEFGSSDDYLMSVECFDAERGLWFSVSPLSQPRAYLGVVQKDGQGTLITSDASAGASTSISIRALCQVKMNVTQAQEMEKF